MKHRLFTVTVAVILILSMASTVFASEETPDTNSEVPVESTIENIKAKPTKTGMIKVSWKKASDVSKYEVYRAKSENGKYKLLKVVKGSSYKDKKIHPKKTYYYKVKAERVEGTNVVESYTSSVVKGKLKIKKSFKVKAYAYSGGGHTKMGKKVKEGRIAVDPKVIKLGTWLYVEGYGICQACDTGGNIKGKTIDVYKKSKKEMRRWGVKKPRIYIIG